jgi:putative FmdB family regulatory protein
MPIYEYECLQCGQIEEALQKFSDRSLSKCRHCSGKLQKLVSRSSFHLKGTGWYATDYANKSGKPSPSASSKKTKDAPSKKDSSKSTKASKQSDD